MDADAVELRVLGCLIEKQRTTPDQYPLSLNSLRLAANQSTNRDPVVEYEVGTIRAALDKLGRRGWTRLASGPSSRAVKCRQLLGADAARSEAPAGEPELEAAPQPELEVRVARLERELAELRDRVGEL